MLNILSQKEIIQWGHFRTSALAVLPAATNASFCFIIIIIIIYVAFNFHLLFCSCLSYIMLLFLLFNQWLTSLWQSPCPRCQVLYVR